ncbi:MAG: hypothetical protein VYB61_01735, partial [Verrucomicrobiota bacterium]|nr:hypothetical protein [Verrucomicrobiota bacterium]
MADEYGSLKNVAWQYRALGWIFGIVTVLVGLIIAWGCLTGELAGHFPPPQRILLALIVVIVAGILTWLEVATLWAVSEFIHLCIRVEYNTRTRTQAQTPVVYHPPSQMGST